jgi:sporulation protein YabP
MDIKDDNKIAPHSLTLKNRKNLEMNGIKEVLNFNESLISLETNQGYLEIKGKELNIHNLNLDSSEIKIEGFINSFEYTTKKNNRGFIKRLFK